MPQRARPRPRNGRTVRDPNDRSWRLSPDQSPGTRPEPSSFDEDDPETSPQRLRYAFLPLRIFFGATFLYAGLDKLIDPTFLRASGPGSIAAQLDGFARISPISPLIQIFGERAPVLFGLLIAVAEIAIGLGALTGLLFRLAAVGGAALSILFWLTASWATKPYYYGPDLPYAFGWLTLALAGHGNLFVLGAWLDRQINGVDAYYVPASAERRRFLEGSVLAAAAVAVAGIGGTLGASLLGRSDIHGPIFPTPSGDPNAGVGVGQTPSPGPTDGSLVPVGSGGPVTTPVPTAVAGAKVIGKASQVTARHAIAFRDPLTGDPGVVVKLPDGSLAAFDAVCTHAGCTVEWDTGSGYLICPCHGATFDPTQDATPIAGPTDQPLAKLPIHVDQATGSITLRG